MTASDRDELLQLNGFARLLESEKSQLSAQILRAEVDFVIREGLSLEKQYWPQHLRDSFESEISRSSFVELDEAEILRIVEKFQLQKYAGRPLSPEELVHSWDLGQIASRLSSIVEFANLVDHVELLRGELNLNLALGRRDADVEPNSPSMWEVVEALARHFREARDSQTRKIQDDFIGENKLWDPSLWTDEQRLALAQETSAYRSKLFEVEGKLAVTYERILEIDSGAESIAFVCSRGADFASEQGKKQDKNSE